MTSSTVYQPGVSDTDDVFDPSSGNASIPTLPRDLFAYPLTFGALAPGASLSQTIQIDAASDFYWTALEQVTMVTGTTTAPTAATLVLPLITIQVNDGGSNRNLFQNPILLPHISGYGSWPHFWRHPRLFKKNSSINITLVNAEATNTYSAVYLTFEGFKVYGS